MSPEIAYTIHVPSLSLSEMWRLGGGPFGFTFLLGCKVLRRSPFRHVHNLRFAPAIDDTVLPTPDLAAAAAARKATFLECGFDYLGADCDSHPSGLHVDYFLNGDTIGFANTSRSLSFDQLLSVVGGGDLVATGNGRSAIRGAPFIDGRVFSGVTLSRLLAIHRERLADRKAQSIGRDQVESIIERIARESVRFNVGRGVFRIEKQKGELGATDIPR